MIFRIRHLILLCFFLFFLGFLILPLDHEWVQRLYGQRIYPNIAAANQFLWSKVPFSIGDIGYAIGMLLIFIRLKQFKFKRHIGLVLTTVFIIISLFYVSWGMHYFKTPLRVSRKLPVTISVAHLKETTQHYAHALTALHQQISPDPATAVATPCVTAATHRAVAMLIDAGANHSQIHEKIKDNARPDRLKLLGIALKNMVFVTEHKAAYITISQDELDSCNYQKGDTEGFVNYGLSVAGIEMAVLMTESKKENMIKMSFRSKGDLAVNLFAKTYFEGGGHINAAGGKSNKSLQETEAYFLKSLATFLS